MALGLGSSRQKKSGKQKKIRLIIKRALELLLRWATSKTKWNKNSNNWND